MATTLETIRRVTIEARTVGVAEATRSLSSLETAVEDVAVTTANSSRALLSAQKGYDALRMQTDAAFRAQTQFEAALGRLDRAWNQGIVDVRQYGEALDNIITKFGRFGSLQVPETRTPVAGTAGQSAVDNAQIQDVISLDNAIKAMQPTLATASAGVREMEATFARGMAEAAAETARASQQIINNLSGISTEISNSAKSSASAFAPLVAGLEEVERQSAETSQTTINNLVGMSDKIENSARESASAFMPLLTHLEEVERQSADTAQQTVNSLVGMSDRIENSARDSASAFAPLINAMEEMEREAAASSQRTINALLGVREASAGSARASAQAFIETARAMDALQVEANQLRATFDQLAVAEEAAARKLQTIRDAAQAGFITPQVETAATASVNQGLELTRRNLGGVSTGARLATNDMANLGYQFQDIAVSLSSGQSPLLVMIQQGSQISQIFAANGGLMVGLRSIGGALANVGRSIGTFLVSPIGLATAGITSLTAAAVIYAIRSTDSVKSVDDVLKAHKGLVESLRDAYGLAADGAEEYGKRSGAALELQAETAISELRASITDELRGAFDNWISEDVIREVRGGALVVADEFVAFREPLVQLYREMEAGNPKVLEFEDSVARIAEIDTSEATQKGAAALQGFTASVGEGVAELARLEGAVKDLFDPLDFLDSVLLNLSDINPVFGTIADGIGYVVDEIDKVVPATEDWKKSWEGFSGASMKLGAEVLKVEEAVEDFLDEAATSGMDDVTAAAYEQTQAWDELSKRMVELDFPTDQIEAVREAFVNSIDDISGYTEAVLEAQKALDDWTLKGQQAGMTAAEKQLDDLNREYQEVLNTINSLPERPSASAPFEGMEIPATTFPTQMTVVSPELTSMAGSLTRIEGSIVDSATASQDTAQAVQSLDGSQREVGTNIQGSILSLQAATSDGSLAIVEAIYSTAGSTVSFDTTAMTPALQEAATMPTVIGIANPGDISGPIVSTLGNVTASTDLAASNTATVAERMGEVSANTAESLTYNSIAAGALPSIATSTSETATGLAGVSSGVQVMSVETGKVVTAMDAELAEIVKGVAAEQAALDATNDVASGVQVLDGRTGEVVRNTGATAVAAQNAADQTQMLAAAQESYQQQLAALMAQQREAIEDANSNWVMQGKIAGMENAVVGGNVMEEKAVEFSVQRLQLETQFAAQLEKLQELNATSEDIAAATKSFQQQSANISFAEQAAMEEIAASQREMLPQIVTEMQASNVSLGDMALKYDLDAAMQNELIQLSIRAEAQREEMIRATLLGAQTMEQVAANMKEFYKPDTYSDGSEGLGDFGEPGGGFGSLDGKQFSFKKQQSVAGVAQPRKNNFIGTGSAGSPANPWSEMPMNAAGGGVFNVRGGGRGDGPVRNLHLDPGERVIVENREQQQRWDREFKALEDANRRVSAESAHRESSGMPWTPTPGYEGARPFEGNRGDWKDLSQRERNRYLQPAGGKWDDHWTPTPGFEAAHPFKGDQADWAKLSNKQREFYSQPLEGSTPGMADHEWRTPSDPWRDRSQQWMNQRLDLMEERNELREERDTELRDLDPFMDAVRRTGEAVQRQARTNADLAVGNANRSRGGRDGMPWTPTPGYEGRHPFKGDKDDWADLSDRRREHYLQPARGRWDDHWTPTPGFEAAHPFKGDQADWAKLSQKQRDYYSEPLRDGTSGRMEGTKSPTGSASGAGGDAPWTPTPGYEAARPFPGSKSDWEDLSNRERNRYLKPAGGKWDDHWTPTPGFEAAHPFKGDQVDWAKLSDKRREFYSQPLRDDGDVMLGTHSPTGAAAGTGASGTADHEWRTQSDPWHGRSQQWMRDRLNVMEERNELREERGTKLRDLDPYKATVRQELRDAPGDGVVRLGGTRGGYVDGRWTPTPGYEGPVPWRGNQDDWKDLSKRERVKIMGRDPGERAVSQNREQQTDLKRIADLLEKGDRGNMNINAPINIHAPTAEIGRVAATEAARALRKQLFNHRMDRRN